MGHSMRKQIRTEDILHRAAGEHIAAEEMDILVSSTRDTSSARERDIDRLRTLLDQIEARIDQS